MLSHASLSWSLSSISRMGKLLNVNAKALATADAIADAALGVSFNPRTCTSSEGSSRSRCTKRLAVVTVSWMCSRSLFFDGQGGISGIPSEDLPRRWHRHGSCHLPLNPCLGVLESWAYPQPHFTLTGHTASELSHRAPKHALRQQKPLLTEKQLGTILESMYLQSLLLSKEPQAPRMAFSSAAFSWKPPNPEPQSLQILVSRTPKTKIQCI